MKDIIANPFPVYGYSGPEYFCDREAETEKLCDAVVNGRNVTLISPRRFGKTGLIHHVFRKLTDRKLAACVYIDIYAVKTLPEFVRTLTAGVFAALETRLERAAKVAGQFLGACRPSVTLDSVTGSPSLSFALDGVASAERTLDDVFSYLKSRRELIVIAIDEFQQVAEFPEKGAEAMLRGYLQFLPNVRFVFAGSREHMMAEMFMTANRPFYKSTQNLSLSTIDRGKYCGFAGKFFKRAHKPFSADAFGFAYDMVDGVTWEVQTVANRLWSSPDGFGSQESVRNVIDAIIAENVDDYSNLMAQMSVNDAKVMREVARCRRVVAPTGVEFVSRVGLSPSSTKLSVDGLCRRQYLYRDRSGVLVYDRFLGLWLSR